MLNEQLAARIQAGIDEADNMPVSYTHLDVYKRQVPSGIFILDDIFLDHGIADHHSGIIVQRVQIKIQLLVHCVQLEGGGFRLYGEKMAVKNKGHDDQKQDGHGGGQAAHGEKKFGFEGGFPFLYLHIYPCFL